MSRAQRCQGRYPRSLAFALHHACNESLFLKIDNVRTIVASGEVYSFKNRMSLDINRLLV